MNESDGSDFEMASSFDSGLMSAIDVLLVSSFVDGRIDPFSSSKGSLESASAMTLSGPLMWWKTGENSSSSMRQVMIS